MVTALDRSGGYESEGWWRTWGGGWDLTRPAPDVTRLYLATQPDRVLDVARRLPAEMEAAGIAWTIKIAAVPEALTRPDAVLLYVRDRDRELAAGLALSALAGVLTPTSRIPFVAQLAPGLDWAEDPGGDESYGQVRCRLLVEAFLNGGDPITAAAATFLAAGIEPSRPHLRAAS